MTLKGRPLTEQDKAALYRTLNIEYEERPQIITESPEVSIPEPDVFDVRAELAKQLETVFNLIGSLEEMQIAIGERLKDRTVRVDPKVNPAVRDAIRRMFGVDSDTITFDMYKKALASRSEAATLERQKIYGS